MPVVLLVNYVHVIGFALELVFLFVCVCVVLVVVVFVLVVLVLAVVSAIINNMKRSDAIS